MAPSCSICIDDLTSPVSLPCGHIFCNQCIVRAVDAIKPYTSIHYCPSCRSPYTIVNIDPNIVPTHLRPHIVPSVRRLYLEETPHGIDAATPQRVAASECGRLNAENTALRINCGLWRKRAEVHAAATLGLLGLARSARDQMLMMKQQKDELERQLSVMKRRIEADDSFVQFSLASSLSHGTTEDIFAPRTPTSPDPFQHDAKLVSAAHHLHTLQSYPSDFSCLGGKPPVTNTKIKAETVERATKRRRVDLPPYPPLPPIIQPAQPDDVIPKHSILRRRSPRKA